MLCYAMLRDVTLKTSTFYYYDYWKIYCLLKLQELRSLTIQCIRHTPNSDLTRRAT